MTYEDSLDRARMIIVCGAEPFGEGSAFTILCDSGVERSTAYFAVVGALILLGRAKEENENSKPL